MVEWTRKTVWRQAHVLEPGTATHLGLVFTDNPETIAIVVVSHDCDIACPPNVEPTIEVIVGQLKEEAEGDFSHGKNVRRLHLKYQAGANYKTIELRAKDRVVLDKLSFIDQAPRTDLVIAPTGKKILQKWLAARYDRSAFPSEFESRLSQPKIPEQISKILKPKGASIRGIYFDLGAQSDLETVGSDENYELNIYLLYDTDDDPNRAENAALEVRVKLEKLFKDQFYEDNKGWKGVELVSCNVISDQAMTVRQALALRQWRLDHMSLRSEPNQPMTE